MRGLSLVAASGGHSSSRCAGLSLSRPLLLQSTGSRSADSATVAHRPSRSAACGIFPDQGSNPCPLHWQADSQPLRHQGSPSCSLLNYWNNFPQTFSMSISFPLPWKMPTDPNRKHFPNHVIVEKLKCRHKKSSQHQSNCGTIRQNTKVLASKGPLPSAWWRIL